VTEQIDPGDVVLGDVLPIGPGHQVVVDGELIGASHLDMDESLVTGESEPVTKQVGDEVLSGSYCVSGQGMYRARKVGFDSLANRLAIEARSFEREYTPLQKEINLVVRILLIVIFYLAALLTLNTLLHDRPMVENASNTSVLFGIVPSSLFLMIVVAYAVGAVRIADKGALVQSINSVESLCHVTLVCLDKTGTLTSNALRLEMIKPVGPEQRARDEFCGLAVQVASRVGICGMIECGVLFT
jgi:cation-transporting P-type ATPase E